MTEEQYPKGVRTRRTRVMNNGVKLGFIFLGVGKTFCFWIYNLKNNYSTAIVWIRYLP